MKTKNSKLFLAAVSLFMTCSTALAACSSNSSSSSSEPVVCNLVQELSPYRDLKATASTNDKYQYSVNVTFKNNGEQYVPLHTYDEGQCPNDGVSMSGWIKEPKCPFENRYIAPNESISVIMDYYPFSSQESCVYKVNNSKCIKTCYYTTEYTGMKFNDLKIRTVTEKEKDKYHLYNDVMLYYKPSGSYKDGDNYHLLVNFTYDGEQYTVMSTDPNYDINAFGLHLESPFYRNFHQWNFEGDEGYSFDESKITINWVKCYTAWSLSKQPGQCKNASWRVYTNKAARFWTMFLLGVGGVLLVVGVVIALILISRRKDKQKVDN